MTIIAEDTIHEDKALQKKKLFAKILMEGLEKIKVEEFPTQDRAVATAYLFTYEDKTEIYKRMQVCKDVSQCLQVIREVFG